MNEHAAWFIFACIAGAVCLAAAFIVEERLAAVLLGAMTVGWAFLAGGWLRRFEESR